MESLKTYIWVRNYILEQQKLSGAMMNEVIAKQFEFCENMCDTLPKKVNELNKIRTDNILKN